MILIAEPPLERNPPLTTLPCVFSGGIAASEDQDTLAIHLETNETPKKTGIPEWRHGFLAQGLCFDFVRRRADV